MAMALLRMPAIEAIHESLDTLMGVIRQFGETACPTCGYPTGDLEQITAVARVASVIINQAKLVLDRAGLPARAVLDVRQSDGDLDLRALTDEERARMMGLLAELRELKEAVRLRIHGTLTGNLATDEDEDTKPPAIM